MLRSAKWSRASRYGSEGVANVKVTSLARERLKSFKTLANRYGLPFDTDSEVLGRLARANFTTSNVYEGGA